MAARRRRPPRGQDASLREGARCDRVGCVVTRADGRSVAYVQEVSAFEEDCRRAALVITRLAAPATCEARSSSTATLFANAVPLPCASTRTAIVVNPPVAAARAVPHGADRAAGSERRDLPAAARPRPPRPSIDLPDAADPPDTDPPLSSDAPG